MEKDNEICECNLYKDDSERIIRQIFYRLYRAKQKISGGIYGAFDGGMTGYNIGMKWGGAGGFGFGAISQIGGMIIPGVCGFVGGCVGGLYSDRQTITQVLKDYRYSIGAGGLPPTHGSFS